uniref:Uncharacterized protein n=1 Tax=Timema bartmani TaxID=61472 RepID=A0A7R9FDU3_9NEOP|nr:unnamed protein product [Timema bartmani]
MCPPWVAGLQDKVQYFLDTSLVSAEECSRVYVDRIQSNHICAVMAWDTDSCFSESGTTVFCEVFCLVLQSVSVLFNRARVELLSSVLFNRARVELLSPVRCSVVFYRARVELLSSVRCSVLLNRVRVELLSSVMCSVLFNRARVELLSSVLFNRARVARVELLSSVRCSVLFNRARVELLSSVRCSVLFNRARVELLSSVLFNRVRVELLSSVRCSVLFNRARVELLSPSESGSPIVIQEEDISTLIGLLSFNDHCSDDPFHPGVASKVSYYLSWILMYL